MAQDERAQQRASGPVSEPRAHPPPEFRCRCAHGVGRGRGCRAGGLGGHERCCLGRVLRPPWPLPGGHPPTHSRPPPARCCVLRRRVSTALSAPAPELGTAVDGEPPQHQDIPPAALFSGPFLPAGAGASTGLPSAEERGSACWHSRADGVSPPAFRQDLMENDLSESPWKPAFPAGSAAWLMCSPHVQWAGFLRVPRGSPCPSLKAIVPVML